jgi:hypothetical protein
VNDFLLAYLDEEDELSVDTERGLRAEHKPCGLISVAAVPVDGSRIGTTFIFRQSVATPLER